MNLVFYIHHDSSEKGITLKDIIENSLNGVAFNTVETFNTLKSRLKQTPCPVDKDIFVLLAESKNRLDELVSLIDLLDNKQIILIIPDEAKETISKASRFFPRFFTKVSNTYDDLFSVLNKMISKTK